MFCETNKLFFNFNKINVLNNISIKVETGKTTVITGKNASGKSTLLKCLNCLLFPTTGSLKHKLNTPLPMLFQHPAVFQNTIHLSI